MPPRRDLREYQIAGVNEGDPWPSVTSILSVIAKPALVGWAGKVERDAAVLAALELLTRPGLPLDRQGFFSAFEAQVRITKAAQRAKEEAADIGKQLHALVEADLKAELGLSPAVNVNALPDAVETSFLHWLEWRRQHHVKPLVMEQVVYSRTHRYAGTLDLVAEVDGARTVVDLKTSRAIYGEMPVQIAAYRAAWAEMGHPTDQGLVLRLPKTVTDPGFEAVPVTDPALFDVFLTALRLFHWWKDAA
jgi:PD-(D/E)XK nuclease superfamily